MIGESGGIEEIEVTAIKTNKPILIYMNLANTILINNEIWNKKLQTFTIKLTDQIAIYFKSY